MFDYFFKGEEEVIAPEPPWYTQLNDVVKEVDLIELAYLILMTTILISLMFQILGLNDPADKIAKKKLKKLLAKRGLKLPYLTRHETGLLSKVVDPADIATGWSEIGGLNDILESTRRTVLAPIIARQGDSEMSKLFQPPRGILLHGPPGCGKTSIAKALAKEADCFFLNLDAASLRSMWYGEYEKNIAAAFSLANKLSPCFIFIDEIDAMLRTRSSMDHDVTSNGKALFMSLWDGLGTDNDKTVIVMGATNLPSSVDPAILRRMSNKIHIPLPGLQERKEILQVILKFEWVDPSVPMEKLAEMTEGFSGSDLKEMARMAVLFCMDQMLASIINDPALYTRNPTPRASGRIRSYLIKLLSDPPKPAPTNIHSSKWGKAVAMEDFRKAIDKVKEGARSCGKDSDPLASQKDPTFANKKAARAKGYEVMDRLGVKDLNLNDHELIIASHLVNPDDLSVGWGDIGGLDLVINNIKSTVLVPISMQKRDVPLSKLIQPHKGVLLHGPPGCGKTSIAKAVAKDAHCRFINLEGSIVGDKWYGESEKLTAAVFSVAEKLQPCIIFIDEIDSLLRVRSAMDHEVTSTRKAQFMSLWDGLITDPTKTVIVMGATNRPQDIDPAILRRMTAKFHIPLPSQSQRMNILNLILKDEVLASDVNIEVLSVLTDGFSGADLKEMAKATVMECLSSGGQGSGGDTLDPLGTFELRPIGMEDFQRTVAKVIDSRI